MPRHVPVTRHVPRYGYYADVANECQLFHVCYPVLYPDGQQEMIKWSFICPNQTIFDQVTIQHFQSFLMHKKYRWSLLSKF